MGMAGAACTVEEMKSTAKNKKFATRNAMIIKNIPQLIEETTPIVTWNAQGLNLWFYHQMVLVIALLFKALAGAVDLAFFFHGAYAHPMNGFAIAAGTKH